MINWEKLVAERTVWVEKNFPPDTPSHSVLGVIEELGELTHHYLKDAQGIRGDHDTHVAEMKDAVGDITVYLLGVMRHRECTPIPTYKHLTDVVASTDDLLFRLTYEVAEMAMDSADISWTSTIPYYLHQFCEKYGWDYEEIVEETWDHVKQRDWTKNKEDGSVELPGPADPVRSADEGQS